jgi:hypothetical protein
MLLPAPKQALVNTTTSSQNQARGGFLQFDRRQKWIGSRSKKTGRDSNKQ